MPTFLIDDDADLVNIDPKHFDLNGAKPNGAAVDHVRPSIVKGTYDENSTLSTRDSDISDATPVPACGDGTRSTSMDSLRNGAPARRVVDSPSTGQPLSNGSVPLPDRTAPWLPPRSLNGGASSDASSATPRRPGPSELLSPERPRSMAVAHVNGGDDGPQAPSAPAPSQSLEPGQADSPHRFSSPPTYNTAPNSLGSSSSGHLQAPPPGAPTLKQRHTLEVPKLPAGRQSRDGIDTALASGRFSPSVAGSTGTRRASLNLVRRTTRSMQSEVPRDEIVPDEDAARWTEAYRQKRASKRRRKEEEDDDRVLVGTKVDESHANWVTAYNMLTGIRVSVSRTNAKLNRELTDADFDVKQKSTFDM